MAEHDTDETKFPDGNTAKIRRADKNVASGEGNPAPASSPHGNTMFQLIGCVLALLAILTALAGAPVAGTVFALLTFVWVIRAKPRQARLVNDDAPWGVVYEMRSAR